MGTVNGSFTTTYGTTGQDPFASGTGTFAATLGGTPQSYSTVGAVAGPDPSGTLVAAVAVKANGTVDVVIIVVDNAVYLPGATVPVDWGSAFGLMQNYDPGTDTWTLVGYIFNGSVHFDEAGAASGQPVSGTFQGELLIPPP